jgi:hypothetical protein
MVTRTENTPVPVAALTAPDPAWPADVAPTLARVRQMLHAEGPEKALEFLSRSKADSPWLTNAVGVCLLRLGQAQRALDTFRGLALGGTGFGLREDAPVRFKANYAAAQLLCGMHAACVITLSQARAESDPSVRRLREGIRRWQGTLSFWQRCRLFLGSDVGPVTLEQPGEL